MITSAANKKVKQIIQINKKSGQRKQEDVFIAEGLKMFQEAPEEDILEVHVSESFAQSAIKAGFAPETKIKLQKCGYETVADEVFSKMADTQTPQGILCMVRQKHYTLKELLDMDNERTLFLVLEGVQDPGNLGTIMRTGEGAGVTGIIMSKETVDVYNPKTIRSTMGSIYRVPFLYTEDIGGTIEEIKKKGVKVYAAHLRGDISYDRYDYREASAFLIGNESSGLTDETADRADNYVRIPMKGKVESLNAGVAASLLIYEAARQRR